MFSMFKVDTTITIEATLSVILIIVSLTITFYWGANLVPATRHGDLTKQIIPCDRTIQVKKSHAASDYISLSIPEAARTLSLVLSRTAAHQKGFVGNFQLGRASLLRSKGSVM